MAHRSQLEGRLMAILDPTRSARRRVAAAHRRGHRRCSPCALMPLASVQPWAIAASQRNGLRSFHRPAGANLPDARLGTVDRRRRRRRPSTRADQPIAADVATAASGLQCQSRVQAGVQSGSRAHPGRTQGDTQSVAQGATPMRDANASPNSDANVHVDIQSMAIERFRAATKTTIRRRHAGRQGGADPRTVAALTAALKDTDKEVRETALHALVQMRDPSIFEPLVQALSDAAPDVREQAAFGLGQLRDRRAVEPLTAR